MNTRAIESGDFEWVLALNEAESVKTSPLDRAKLERMVSNAFLAAAIEREAFVIAFDEDAEYDSQNFLWFKKALARFAYVDRVVVSPHARRRGHARALYQAVFAAARAGGHERVACEVNYAPPNPVSDAFHESLGFTEIGRAALANGKGVRYLIASLT
jgi:predicted GNAT superfamily acetyltransferase